MKALVKTLDTGTRINTVGGEVLNAFRPSVVTVTEFIRTLAMSRLIQPIGNELPDTATDAEFEKFYIEADKDLDFACDAFFKNIHDKQDLDSAADEAASKQSEIEQEAEQKALAEASLKAEQDAAAEAKAKAEVEAKAKAAAETAAKTGAK